MSEHVHDYQPVVRRVPGTSLEMIDGYRCACGQRRPLAASTFDPLANARAALAIYRRRFRQWRKEPE